jgi:hypothetical protein
MSLELTTPAAPFEGGFAAFFLMARPPLLFQEGNSRASGVYAIPKQGT